MTTEPSTVVSIVKSAIVKVETAVTGWTISGWAAVAAMVAANLIGVFLHF